MTADKSKKRKSIMGPDGNSPATGSGMQTQPTLDRRESSIRESISGPSGGGATNNKKGPQQGNTERRQLTEEEERVYGVSQHERLTASGPLFRHERILKPITSKSAIQQTKIYNVLAELGIPPKLIMPTQETGELFEALLTSIHTLLDMRKTSEKLAGEIAVQKAVKEQKEAKEEAKKGDGNGEMQDPAEEVREGGEELTKRETSAAPSARGHKRSVSVMSAASESSTKRQKK
jgi:DNA methyltransferase 1-associated protein 1